MVCCLVLSPHRLPGQRADTTNRFRTSRAVAESRDGENNGAIRLGTAVGGAALGFVVGGFAGYNILPHRCQCDDPGLDELILGALVGSAAGAALGAALPSLNSVCAFDQRLKRTIVGGLGAAALGFVFAGGLNGAETTVFITPVLGVGGSLASLGHCWKSRGSTLRSAY